MEAGKLLWFINTPNNIYEAYHGNIYNNFVKHLITECKTPEKLKEVLDNYGSKITEFIKSEIDFISKVRELEDSFKDNVDILTN